MYSSELLPSLACDTHVHCFEPQYFPYCPDRAYTPASASVDELLALHKNLGISRCVFVQPSVYGIDNRCQIHAIQKYNAVPGFQARGVAVIDSANTSAADLSRLYEAGMRGLRLNLRVVKLGGSQDPLTAVRSELRTTYDLVAKLQAARSWHLQVHANLEVHSRLLDDYAAFASSGIPVVLDHFAGTRFLDIAPLLEAMTSSPIYVKLSAAYRLPEPQEAVVLAKRFFETVPEQCLWASDWPHTGGAGGQGRKPEDIEPFRPIDNHLALETVRHAVGEDGARQMLVHNPARLYDF